MVNLEQFWVHQVCDREEHQAVYFKYTNLYGRYSDQYQVMNVLIHQNDLLSFNTKHKISYLELNNKHIWQMLEQQTLIADILQHKSDITRESVHGGDLFPDSG